MKHHKFMAFCHKEKEWIWPYPKGFGLLEDISVQDVLEKYVSHNYNNLEIVQYTGLDDRSDREIYEGHIVECRPVPDIKIVCVVKLVEGVYEVHGKGGFYNRLSLFTQARAIRVIGHRLDTPDLMEKIERGNSNI